MSTGSYTNIRIKRIKASRFISEGGVDHTAEFTITGQIFQQLKKNNYDAMK